MVGQDDTNSMEGILNQATQKRPELHDYPVEQSIYSVDLPVISLVAPTAT
jgi:hypothetical protein